MTAMTPAQNLQPETIAAPGNASGWQASLDLIFARRGVRTALVHGRHYGPLRLQKPLYPEGEQVCHAIVLHPPAGIVGGDGLRIDVSVAEGAHALLTTPGAGKWYRSAGVQAQMVQRIRVGREAVCEWLPQESIVFNGALGRLETDIELETGARFIGMDMLCFGRTGSGERFDHGCMTMQTRVRVGGRSLWLERGQVAGGGPLLQSPVGLAGQPVTGTLLVVGPEVNEAMRDACREPVPAAGEGAVTLLPGVLVARYLGPSCEPGRDWFVALLERVRPLLLGLPMRVPRIWKT